MSKVTLQGTVIETLGSLPLVGVKAPCFTLVKQDLSEISLKDLKGKSIILNIFPSIDTGVCATSVRMFNKEAANIDNVVVLCVSADLPFAAQRFCGAEGIENVITGSTFRSGTFGADYGVTFKTGPLVGLLARSVVVIDPGGVVKYTELVSETVNEPNYEAALQAVSN